MFQSSAAPKGGCNAASRTRASAACSFNPQPPRRAAATRVVAARLRQSLLVSILSRPEGRLQRPHERAPGASAAPVSILSRPEGRLQLPSSRRPGSSSRRFQSSAAPKGGCNPMPLCTPCTSPRQFQSAAAPKGGCNPSRRPHSRPSSPRFQSSAAPKGGCNRVPCTRFGESASFNPQPPRRAAATTPTTVRHGRPC